MSAPRVVGIVLRPDQVGYVVDEPVGHLVHSACDADLRTRSAAHADLASRVLVEAGGRS